MSDPVAVAIDIGGTGIKCALVDPAGEIRHAARHPTGAERGPEAVVETILARRRRPGRAGPARRTGPGRGRRGRAGRGRRGERRRGLRRPTSASATCRCAISSRRQLGLPTALGHDVRAARAGRGAPGRRPVDPADALRRHRHRHRRRVRGRRRGRLRARHGGQRRDRPHRRAHRTGRAGLRLRRPRLPGDLRLGRRDRPAYATAPAPRRSRGGGAGRGRRRPARADRVAGGGRGARRRAADRHRAVGSAPDRARRRAGRGRRHPARTVAGGAGPAAHVPPTARRRAWPSSATRPAARAPRCWRWT